MKPFLLSLALMPVAFAAGTADLLSTHLMVGADDGSSLAAPTRTAATIQEWTLMGMRYDQVAPDVALLGYDDDGASTSLRLGSAPGATNSATEIRFYTSSTYNGTPRLVAQMTSGGTFEVGTYQNTTTAGIVIARAPYKVGSNLAAAEFRLNTGAPTGNADGSSLTVYTARDGGSSGTTQREPSKSFEVSKNGLAGYFPWSAATVVYPPGSIGNATSVTSTGNSAGAETAIANYVTPASITGTSGDVLRLRAFGSFNNNTNSKTLRVKFGATTLASTGALAFNDGAWEVDASVARTSPSTAVAMVSFRSGNAILPTYVFPLVEWSGSFSATNHFAITGEGASANDVVCRYANWSFVPR